MADKTRLLLWDIDGTLILGGRAGSKALKRYFEEQYGWNSVEKAIVVHGMTDPGIVQGVFDHFGHSPEKGEIERVLDDYVGMMRDNPEGFSTSRSLPGVPDILRAPQAGPRCVHALLTGNVKPAARLKLEHHGLWDHFSFGAFGSDAVKREELIPIAWNRAEEATGQRFSPEQTWIIGDTARDYHAARHHGANVVLVRTNPIVPEGELDACDAELILDDLNAYDLFWSTIGQNVPTTRVVSV